MQLSKFTVRTSERRVFRRCLRKWGFQSSKRMNLQRKGTEQNINFWFGSAIHFAMEDWFGHNKFGDITKAFQAYYAAFPPADRPEGADEHYYLGLGMLDYFKEWYPRHNQDYQFQTVWLNDQGEEVAPGTEGARPLVEESFLLDLGVKAWVDVETEEIIDVKDKNIFKATLTADAEVVEEVYYIEDEPEETVGTGGISLFQEPTRRYIKQVPICYHGTMDRIVKDRLGRWWIMDWKTAKGADTNKLDTDDQISAYMWAAEQWFERPIHGFVYVQLTKDLAKEPKRLANGQLSVDKKQKTTYARMRQALIREFGEVSKAPKKYIDFLNHLATLETPEGDRFIRWDLVHRTKEQKISTYNHILAEVKLMVDPELYLFPNPTRDCIWDCPFRDVCLMMDNGQEKEAEEFLNFHFEPRPRTQDGNIEPWRENIPWPEKYGEAVGTMLEKAVPEPEVTLNLILPDKYKEDVEV